MPAKKFEIDFKTDFERVVTFERTASSEALAVDDAKTGFQWRYGYWPDEPVEVRTTSIEG